MLNLGTLVAMEVHLVILGFLALPLTDGSAETTTREPPASSSPAPPSTTATPIRAYPIVRKDEGESKFDKIGSYRVTCLLGNNLLLT